MYKVKLLNSPQFTWVREHYTFKLVGESADWCAQALGYVPSLGIINGLPQYVLFESESDYVTFSLTWSGSSTEPESFKLMGYKLISEPDLVAHHCPYVP